VENLEERLILSTTERTDFTQDKIYTDFCIAVESINSMSSYTLKVFPFISESLYLTFGFPETSYLEPYEIHNYQLILYGKKNLNFTLSLHKKFGDSTIAVRKCNHRNRM